MPRSKPFDFNRAVERVPKWILTLAAAGTAVAAFLYGLRVAGGFLLGALAAWFNYRLLVRAADRLASTKAAGGTTPKVVIQFTALLLGAFVIIESSGFNLGAALAGFLVCPAAVTIELICELITYDHS